MIDGDFKMVIAFLAIVGLNGEAVVF